MVFIWYSKVFRRILWYYHHVTKNSTFQHIFELFKEIDTLKRKKNSNQLHTDMLFQTCIG